MKSRKSGRGILKKIFNLKIMYKMLLVYIAGGIIPVIFIVMYTNSRSGRILITSRRNAVTEDTRGVSDSIKESMNVMESAADNLAHDRSIREIAKKNYSEKAGAKGGRSDFRHDCHRVKKIWDYLNFYRKNISAIEIYLKNMTVSYSDYNSVPHFSYVDNSVEDSLWYSETVSSKNHDGSFWYCGLQKSRDVNCIQVCRPLMDSAGKILGAVVVTIEPEHICNMIDRNGTEMMLLWNTELNGKELVYSNFQDTKKYSFIEKKISGSDEKIRVEKITEGVEDYQVIYTTLNPRQEDGSFELISVENYNDILESINKMSLSTMIPALAGVAVSFLLICGVAGLYNYRINLLRQQMKKAARGEFDDITPVNGNDEIAEIYRELERMIKEINRLNEKVVSEQVQKEKIHTKQKEAEFKMLSSQINPHFLYNTLETIRMKAIINNEKEIQDLVKMLGKIMRYSLQAGDAPVALGDEIKMTDYYLKIQACRFGDRIISELVVDDNVDRSVKVMPLIIQPFVENSFSHGLEGMDEGGRLIVHVSQEENVVIIKICDNGEGMDVITLGELRRKMNDFEHNDTGHIGVTNVNQRIKMRCGEPYGVQVESRKGEGTCVTITVPAEK